MLADKEINSVLIGTRHNAHARMIIDSINAGKHVFVEKPLCINEAELEEITKAYNQVEKNGIRILVGFNRRFSSHAEQAHAFFKNRNNPLVMTYRVNAGAIPSDHWIQDLQVGGGRLIGEGCHFIDYMAKVSGALPVAVNAVSIKTHSSGITNDQIIVTLEFSDGSIGNLIYVAGGDSALAKERFEAHGDGKSLVMDDFLITEMYANGRKTTHKTSKRDKGFEQEMHLFAETVKDTQSCPMEFAEIVAITKATLFAVQSLLDGKRYQF